MGRAYGGHDSASHLPIPLQKVDIGEREIVGYGGNGEVTYVDSVMSPFPAIRFKEKKVLYRASFCQTLAEIEAPTGEWKSILGWALISVSIGLWGYLWMKAYVYPPLPDTITNEDKMKAQIDRMIAMRVNPIEGLTSNYDYEKGQWKKN